MLLRRLASLGHLDGWQDGCMPPSSFNEDGLQAYAKCAGEQELLDWAEEHGLDRDLASKALHGDLSWRDVVRPYMASQGFHGDPTQVVRDDGSIDWKEAAGQGGAFAAYAACASDPATAPLAPICSEAGYYGGQALYTLALKGYDRLEPLAFWKWSWGGDREPPPPYAMPSSRIEIIRLMAVTYRNKGYLDYLMNLAMLRGVAFQYFALARSIESIRAGRALQPMTGEEALKHAGYAPPIGYDFLLSGLSVTPPPPTEPHGRWWQDWNFLEHELLYAMSPDVPAPRFTIDPPAATWAGPNMVRDADFDAWSIEHTNQAFVVRCVGHGMVSYDGLHLGLPKNPDGSMPTKADPLFKLIAPSPYHGGEASSGSCVDKWVNIRARVYFDPHVRAFCDRDRAAAIALKDVMLVAMQTAADRAVFQALHEEPQRLLMPGGLRMSATKFQPVDALVHAGKATEEQCSSYGSYIATHKGDLLVAAALAAAGAVAGRLTRVGVPLGVAAGAVAGGGYLLGARADWKDDACSKK